MAILDKKCDRQFNMKIIHTSAKVKNGQLIVENCDSDLSESQEVKVVIIVPGEKQQAEFDLARQEMQKSFQEAGIETHEQILNLINEVKADFFISGNRKLLQTIADFPCLTAQEFIGKYLG
jgi:predicted nucleic acid-binding protein